MHKSSINHMNFCMFNTMFFYFCSQIVHNTEFHLRIFDHLFTSQAREIQPELNGDG